MPTLLYGTGVYGDTYGEGAGAVAATSTIRIRERPPLRLSHDIETPSGKHYRWAEDEPKAENIPSSVQFSDTMPGGFENGGAVLPRKPGIAYSDLESLSTWTIYGPGAEIAWQGRLERAPHTSGEQMAVSPSAVGWQAHLEDDKSAREIYIDRDLSRWGEASSVRRLANIAAGVKLGDGQTSTLSNEQTPILEHAFTRLASPPATRIESWYDSNQIAIGNIGVGWNNVAGIGSDANWDISLYTANSLRNPSAEEVHFDTDGVSRAFTYHTVVAGRYAAFLMTDYGGTFTGDGQWIGHWHNIAVYGRHGLAGRGTTDPLGYYASDVVGHAVGGWAPLLTINSDSIQPSSFVIPQMAFLEPTTAGEIIRQATRFGLEDWAVWEDKEFVWHQRGARGRRWRARIAPSQLEETGQDAARLFESVIVQYQDVDGTTRTVGPVGSGADTISTDLKDDDSENPANKLGIIKRALLQMGIGTAASATEIGRRFLEEQKVLDRSGRARLVGHVQDDRGVWHPYWKVRAGDYISFVDSSDTSYRRIVKTDKTHNVERACSVDLDAPPEGLQALLERLSVVLVPLGL